MKLKLSLAGSKEHECEKDRRCIQSNGHTGDCWPVSKQVKNDKVEKDK